MLNDYCSCGNEQEICFPEELFIECYSADKINKILGLQLGLKCSGDQFPL
jgi:hypothetical protein